MLIERSCSEQGLFRGKGKKGGWRTVEEKSINVVAKDRSFLIWLKDRRPWPPSLRCVQVCNSGGSLKPPNYSMHSYKATIRLVGQRKFFSLRHMVQPGRSDRTSSPWLITMGARSLAADSFLLCMVWSRASRYGSIACLSLHRVQKMLTNETFFFKTFYQMKEDRRPNASNGCLFSLGGKKGMGSSHPRDRVIPGRFARAHFL